MEISFVLGIIAIIVGCIALLIGLRTLYFARQLQLKWYKILVLLGSVGSIVTFLLLLLFGPDYESIGLIQQIFAQLSLTGLHWFIARDALNISDNNRLLTSVTNHIEKIINSDK